MSIGDVSFWTLCPFWDTSLHLELFFWFFFEIVLTNFCWHIIICIVVNRWPVHIYADVAELVDAQDLKSCGWINRAGSIPAICTKTSFCRTLYNTWYDLISRLWEFDNTKTLNRFKRSGLFLTKSLERRRFLWYYVTYN